jgi:hypothetical protein
MKNSFFIISWKLILFKSENCNSTFLELVFKFPGFKLKLS